MTEVIVVVNAMDPLVRVEVENTPGHNGRFWLRQLARPVPTTLERTLEVKQVTAAVVP